MRREALHRIARPEGVSTRKRGAAPSLLAKFSRPSTAGKPSPPRVGEVRPRLHATPFLLVTVVQVHNLRREARPLILVIDNYDSFTYNLVQYLGELGAEVVVRRNDELTVEDVAAMRPEGVLVSPGPGTPQEAGISLDVIRELGSKISIFGVCLG
ncbi:MAG: hypothetical protein GXY23_12730, partial [Myxococcales bacterium]|nr:hypothetical protein [Myxococcales bacterium]